MTDRKALLELGDRCEREEPSRELDEAIALACGWESHKAAWGLVWWRKIGAPDWEMSCPRFTTSLDSAATLVPPNSWRETNGPRKYIHIPSPAPNFWRCEITTWEGTARDHIGWAKSEAMAICAAALRALASQEKKDE